MSKKFPAKKNTKRAAHGGVRLAKLHCERQDRTGEVDERDSNDGGESAGVCEEYVDSVAELAPTFMYKEVPEEVLIGAEIDLSMWSVVARDSCLLRLGGRKRPRARGREDATAMHPNQLADAVAAAATNQPPPPTPTMVQRLNLHGAEHITDQAVATIAKLCPNLTSLDVSRAVKVSDTGLRHLINACRRLQTLQMNFLPSLRGVAMSVIAECHLSLRELSLAGCPLVPEFALKRVLLACGSTLERLDLSFCEDSVTDGTMLALGQHCGSGRLQSLRLRGCHQISDAGVVHVANSCPNLSSLDLTRFDLAYKLNDIALLSIAEKCALLQKVQLSGCESLTDVGVSWLAAGCQALVHLDLAGCTKVTDISLRAIGDHSLRLRNLSIKNCVRVTNLGLRHLALGCPELAHLDVSGLVHLSDSHETQLLMGIAAIASHCLKLHHLDLSRCSSIGDATLHALAVDHHSQTSQLAVLHLAGCTRVSSRGVREFLQERSKQLTAFSVLGCSRLDDHAFDFRDLARSSLALPLLTVLRLRHCALITDASVRTIAQANPPLRELDLSGCSRLTDMAVLALTESSIVSSSLRFLWLCNLTEISETALAWLAECCPKLLRLDLTGCPKIHAFSLQALASSWKFAVYSRRFKGLKPIHRAEDRLFVEEYGDCWRAAIRIQSLFRARAARRVAAQRREEQLQVWVATKLQSVYRGRQARKVAIVRRLQFDKESHAARRIQMCYRRRLARCKAEWTRAQRLEQVRESAAMCVQLAWRRKKLLERTSRRQLVRLRAERRVQQAAVKLQRLWRGKRTRDQVNVMRVAKQLRDREQHEAANKMQTVFRIRAARREANAKWEQKKEQQQQQKCAVLMLQRRMRRRHAQRELARRRREERRLDDAARSIQRKWRVRKRNFALQLVAFTKQRKWEHEAAVKLQASWKRKKGRDTMRLLRVLKKAQDQERVDAAVRLQTAWRAKKVWGEAMAAKHAALERIVRELRLHNRCADLIQAHYRGRRGREQYRALVVERKKQRWKQIVHPDTGKPFYYNKETGEVRFRCPQDMLDLLPKQMCGNCVPPEISVAQVECQDCGEVYCNECWRHVHAGGRRKAHTFRALYDYYGKRVDYGDGEFPSRWPSEIQQDEMDGWALRTYPLRMPVETRRSWEMYETDASVNGGHRWWFYNKETEANCYTAPPQWDGDTQPSGEKRAAWPGTNDASGWSKYFDEALGYAYYHNPTTGESTYERPLSYLTPRNPETFTERSADGWTKYVDPSTGAAYYYNATTGESTYARPVSFLTPRRGQAPVEAASSSDGWAKYYDDAQAVYYYYNAWTRTSSYERPTHFHTPRVAETSAQQHMFLDGVSQRKYAFDPQTTECRAVVTVASAAALGFR